jgi:hypothetical protein
VNLFVENYLLVKFMYAEMFVMKVLVKYAVGLRSKSVSVGKRKLIGLVDPVFGFQKKKSGSFLVVKFVASHSLVATISVLKYAIQGIVVHVQGRISLRIPSARNVLVGKKLLKVFLEKVVQTQFLHVMRYVARHLLADLIIVRKFAMILIVAYARQKSIYLVDVVVKLYL